MPAPPLLRNLSEDPSVYAIARLPCENLSMVSLLKTVKFQEGNPPVEWKTTRQESPVSVQMDWLVCVGE
ncbi:hypothetical protein CEXT_664361 [Caerostris extrusa]|uniref:Uncharacterized protein n=1 Tax=Caerostris extrusa TaxID=172846 RepID=A0AAV4X8X0_CAEEX|nr:hypothetical protein CEXT_664361 [Caerostris extrusa]